MTPFHAGRLVVAGGLLVLLAVWVMTREGLTTENVIAGAFILVAIIALLLGVDIRRGRRDDEK